MSTTIHFLGTGDAFGSGGRLQACALVEASRTKILVDCGTSALSALRSRGSDPNAIDAVLLTHLHGDHFGGVPFLLMDAHYASGRRAPLVIAGPPGVEARVHALQDALFVGTGRLPMTFDLRFEEIDPSRAFDIAGWSVMPYAVEHSSQTTCYGLRLERPGSVLAFSGDTAWTDSLLDLARGADLFVCECYGFDAAPPGHLDYQTLMRHRADLVCGRLLLTHMGDEMLARAPALGVETVHDGMTITISR